MGSIVISTFYKFIDLPQFSAIKEPLLDFCKQQDLSGTILLASEGINATIAGSRLGIDAFYVGLEKTYQIVLTNIKESFEDSSPFRKMKVRLKKEIVKLGVPGVNGQNVGQYIAPEEWDDFIAQEDVVLIDTRNSYEVKLGTFEGAVNPMTNYFNEFPAWFNAWVEKQNLEGKKIAMCCTGGVRCEKSTAFLKTKGFKDVYHLDGGILGYLEKNAGKAQKWSGDCYVFDDRIAVNADLQKSPGINPSYEKEVHKIKGSNRTRL